MYCQKCGNEILDGASFCTSCGAPIDGAAQPAAGAPQTGGGDAAALEAMVARHAPYYLEEFQKLSRGEKAKFNWAAFLLGPAMCFYRKCANLFFKYFLLPILLLVAAYAVVVVGSGLFDLTLILAGTVLSSLAGIFVLVQYIRFGRNFNREYFAICKQRLEPSAQPAPSGVSLKAVILYCGAWAVLVVVLSVLVPAALERAWGAGDDGPGLPLDPSIEEPFAPDESAAPGWAEEPGPLPSESAAPEEPAPEVQPEPVSDQTYGLLPVAETGYIYFDGAPFVPYEFNDAAWSLIEQTHLNANGEFVDAFGTPSMEMSVLYGDWASYQTAGDGYTDYFLLTAFCAITGIDGQEYEDAMASVGYASDPVDYTYDGAIVFKPGDEIISYFSITGYGQFATVMQYMEVIPEMETQFYYWVDTYANPSWSEYETCAVYADEFGFSLEW